MKVLRTLGAYGVTLVLGLFGASGVMRSCTPTSTVSAPLPIAAECVQMVNQQRAAAGMGAVTSHPALQKAAELHSADQAKRNKMTHTGANGSNAGWRISAQGYNWATWGENVAAGQGDCTSVMGAWMASAGHRANILNPAFISIGMGAVKAKDGTIYWTMDLAAPPR